MTNGSVLFPFDKGGSVVLANSSLCGTETTFYFSTGPVLVFLLKPAPFASSPQVSAAPTSMPFLFSFSPTLALSWPLCPLHSSNPLADLPSLSSCTLGLQWIPEHSFLPRNSATDELARRGALLVPSAVPCSLHPLTSRIHSCIFSDWRCTVSSKFFDTQVSSVSTEELVLPLHGRCVLSRLRCNRDRFLLSTYLTRIGRIENPSCSASGHPSQDTSCKRF